jgi:hypothetical protein
MTPALHLITLKTALALVSAPLGAFAGTPTVDDLIDQGLELRRQARGLSPDAQRAKLEQALELLQRAHAQAPSPRTLAQMGLAEQSLGRWLDADSHLAAALASTDYPWIIKNRGLIEQSLAGVGRHIGRLLVQGSPPGASVYVNGQPRGTVPLPAPVQVAEGEASVQITAPGHQPFITTLKIIPEAVATIDTALERIDAASTQPRPVDRSSSVERPNSHSSGSPAPPPKIPRWLAVGALSAGAVLIASGVWSFARSGQDECSAGDMRVSCRSSRAPAFAIISAGVVTAGLGTFWILYNPDPGQAGHAFVAGFRRAL